MQNVAITRFLVLFIGLGLPILGVSQTNDLHARIESAQVEPGQEFCLDVRVDNFTALRGLQFGLQWDSTVLQFLSYGDLQTSDLLLTPSNFGTSLADDGNLLFSWFETQSADGIRTLPDNALLFQLCFRVIGGEGTSTMIIFDNEVLQQEVTYQNYTAESFSTEAGVVQVGEGSSNSDSTVHLRMGEITDSTGATVCLNVFTENFDSLISMNLSVRWDANVAEFVGPQNLNLPGLTESDFELVEDGFLRINWQTDNPNGITLAPQVAPYSLCFKLTGDPGASTNVRFHIFETINANGDTLSTTGEDGSLSVGPGAQGDSTDFRFEMPRVIAAPNERFCLPVYAKDFKDILSTQYTIAWDPAVLQFEEVRAFNLPDLVSSSFGYRNIEEGMLINSWHHRNVTGVTLPDSIPMYEICFTAIGELGESTAVEFRDTPVMIEVTQAVGNGSTILTVGFKNGSVQIGERENFVLPGDTDRDDAINHFDLLNIGLGFGQNGPARPNASTAPTAQLADDWAQATPATDINFKHADTNGDGTINAADTSALVQNWGFQPDYFSNFIAEDELETLDGRNEKPPFFVLPDTLQPGTTIELPVILGNTDNPAENVYGLAFSLKYDSTVIVPGSVRMSFEESWLGELETDMLVVQREFAEAGRLDVAITRINGTNISGSGAIGKLHLTIEDVIFFDENEVDDRSGSGEYELNFSIENVRLIDSSESEQEVTTTESVSLIETEVTGTKTTIPEERLRIYPNPVQEVLHLQVEKGSVKTIRVFDSMGKVVQTLPASTQVPVHQLRAGRYTLQVITDERVIVSHFIVVH